MRIRRTAALTGTCLILFGCFLLYLMTDLTFPQRRGTANQEFEDNKWIHFEDRLKRLESDLNKHHEVVGEIKRAIKELKPGPHTLLGPSSEIHKAIQSPIIDNVHRNGTPVTEVLYGTECALEVNYVPQTNIQMLDMYKELKFDNIDGGVWKQGFRIDYNVQQWNKHRKLKVFVVPHSHNDPGWIKTLEQYFEQQTRNILDNMVVKLAEDRRRKFIWAEISYLSMWWSEIESEKQKKVKEFIANGQLEIVTGGWVMNDEANTHWIAMIDQMIEGHQWLAKHLNYTPHNSWSIDPFGQSPTMTFLLKRMGLENLVIQRVHYAVKKQLASHSQLEFRWRQLWDGSGRTELFTHLMPFYSYDVPHTCGPDPKICCQFDFKRLPGYGPSCPWRIPPKTITERNVAHRAEMLLDQYRKKSQLYRTNVVLAPLGDDFRYDHSTEWDVQYSNYQRLFDYMNSQPTLNVEAQFGTLSDYFKAVHEEKEQEDFPTLSGDFFTYADRADHYWSGYFTSRPFYKRMDRVLLSYVRAADQIIALAWGSGHSGSSWLLNPASGLEPLLHDARQSLSLFQHHDGITGTARDHVVIDYGQKMLTAIRNAQHVIQQAANVLLASQDEPVSPDPETTYYEVDDTRSSHDALSQRQTITIGPGVPARRIVLYNTLLTTRHETVTFIVSTPFFELTDLRGKPVQCQVSPIFEHGASMSENHYELSFVANIPAMGLVTYTIATSPNQQLTKETNLAKVKIFNFFGDTPTPPGFNNIEISATGSDFSIQNHRVMAAFNNHGLLKALRVGTTTLPVHLDFAKYGVRLSSERSGAYLFLPDDDALPVNVEMVIVKVIEGPVYSSVIVQLPHVHHTVKLFNSPGADSLGLEIHNIVDISKTNNFELVMRLSTNINNTDEFFTDLNGYQMIRRKRFPKLPLQANYYPLPSMAYIEDEGTRLTLLTAGPLGVASMRHGQLEVMQDRRLAQDDNRGLGQGVMDNHPTRHIFRLLLERKTHKCSGPAESHPAGFPSLSAHVASQSLLNPILPLIWTGTMDTPTAPGYSPVHQEPGVDITLPVMRTNVLADEKDDTVGLVFHRQFVNLCYVDRLLLDQFPLSSGKVNISALIPPYLGSHVTESTLSFMHTGRKVDLNEEHSLCPMEVQAYLLHRLLCRGSLVFIPDVMSTIAMGI